MNEGLQGKRFAIAGATSALGSAIAQMLDKQGARLLLLGRSRDKLGALKTSLGTPAQHAIAVTNIENDPENICETILNDAEVNGRIDGGVYCPGIGPLVPLRAIKAKQIEEIFRINFVGSQMFTKALASKNVRQPEGGRIILIGSVAASRGNMGISTYCASKAALVVAVRSLALELASLKIRVNCVSPGWFESPLAQSSLAWHPGGQDEVAKLCPLGIGTPDDIAGAVVYLLSDMAKWITGINFIVDGGYLA